MSRNIIRIVFVIFACLAVSIHSQSNASSLIISNELEKPRNLTAVEGWQNFEKSVKHLANTAVKMLLPKLMESSTQVNVTKQCMRESMQLLAAVKTIKPWAIKFLDSSAKIIDGILAGSMSSLGAYDACINIEATSSKSRDKGKVLFYGKYCSIHLTPPLPPKPEFYKLDEVLDELKNFSEGGTAISEAAKYAHFFHFLNLRLGVCVPSGCTVDDVDNLAKTIGKAFSLSAWTSRCEMKEENEFPPVVVFVISVFSFLGFLMLVGSLIDIYSHYTKTTFSRTCVKALLAFSLFTNFRKFVDTKSSSDHLTCLNGVRFLCMSWVVLGHTYLTVNFQMFRGLEKVRAYAKDFAFQAVINASVAVDTFFFMGGLLVCYLTIKLVKQEGHPFNIKLYIFHRIWRIIPVYACVIMFMFLGNLLGSGPLWHDTTDKYITYCYDNWWSNLVFINNFYDAERMCIPQSWYIASDFQLYIAALIILIPLLRWPKVGLSMCVLGIIASVVYSGVGTYVNNYPPTMLFAHPDPDQRNKYWANFYFKPFVHAGPYCIGLLTGYLLATKPKMKIPAAVQVVGWCLAFVFCFSVLYGVVEWNRGVEPSFWEGMLYASLNRVAWTLGVAWMVLCCSTGHGGVINYILTWKAFVPLGRLTFVVYLIHPIVQISAVGNIRTLLQPDHFLAVWVYFGHLFVTYGAAFAGSMLVEAPTLALEKILIPRNEKKSKDSTLVQDNSVLKGTLTTEKDGSIAVILPAVSEESLGVDNKAVVYRL
ncbi:nose resistant to fluoxetine protein 6-like [Uloborus diversus]|uniref:nose resistant to fluoxetine protein 6-like n=1 Tax=Uloborus diversus TaxID=327109 RepID=UPI0024090311|nr:nose resistant to fluoxetine protein 6-like [Uloborus diversus]